MTPILSDIFMSYEPCSADKRVQMVDGTLLVIVGIGSIKMTPIGLLTHILHVPKLYMSLISVQKLAKMNEYQIMFNDVDVFLCNKVYGWKIVLY